MRQTVVITEVYNARKVKQTGTTLTLYREFNISGTKEPADCLDLGPQIGDLDDVLPTFVVQNRSLRWFAQGGGASDIVRLEVDYQQPTTPQSSGGDAEATYSYEFTSESDHVDVARTQVHYGKQPATGEEKLINFDGQTVDGVEVDSPILEFTEEHVFTEAEFAPSYRCLLASCVKCVNNVAWREFDTGTVIFDGASAQKRGKRWYVSFRFRVRQNLINEPFTIVNQAGASELVLVTKLGWEYLWVNMEKRSAEANTKVTVAPSAVHVAEVYRLINFAVLGIGTEPLN